MTHTKECRGNINSPYAAKDHTCQRESMGERGIIEYVISKLLLGHFHFIYKVCVCVCVWLHLEACRFSSLMRDQGKNLMAESKEELKSLLTKGQPGLQGQRLCKGGGG